LFSLDGEIAGFCLGGTLGGEWSFGENVELVGFDEGLLENCEGFNCIIDL
jgi:hypothetical protein